MAVTAKYQAWMDEFVVESCKRVGDTVIFDHANTRDDVKKAFQNAAKGSELTFKIASKAVADNELAMLKAAYPNVKFDTGTVFKCVAANTRLDMEREMLSKPVLDLFAAQINTKSITIMWQHMRETHGLGRVFAAQVEKAAGDGFELIAYLLVATKATIPHQPERGLVEAIEGEYVTDVSLRFRAYCTVKEVKIGNETRYHWEYVVDPQRPETASEAKVLELSFVDYASQGTTVTKAANIEGIEFINENVNMKHDLQIKVGEKSYTLSVTVDGDKVTADTAALETAIKTEIEGVTTKLAEATKAVETLRSPLEADVVNAKLTGLDEATVKGFAAEKLIETAKAVTTGTKPVEPKETTKAAASDQPKGFFKKSA